MKIFTKTSLQELTQMSENFFGDMVKAVIDIDRKLIALDAELHSDLEALLLEAGSKQNSPWGINLYPKQEDFLEFDSIINLRPSQGNKSRGVDSAEIRQKITDIINNQIEK